MKNLVARGWHEVQALALDNRGTQSLNRAARAGVTLLLLGALSSAQTRRVVPAAQQNAEGIRLRNIIPGVVRSESWVGQLLFPVTGRLEGAVKGIAFRRDHTYVHPVTYPRFTLDTEVLAGHAAVDHYTPSWVLSKNLGNDVRTVLKRKKLPMPAVPWQASGPFPFSYVLPFDTPVKLTKGRTAIFELRFYGSTLDTTRFPWIDATSVDYSGPKYMRQSYGEQVFCSGPHDNLLLLFQPLVVGQACTLNRTPHGPWDSRTRVFAFGGTSRESWGPVRLPFELAALGARGCFIYASWEWVWPAIDTNPVGFNLAALDLPLLPGLVGRRLYMQAVVFHALTNPLDIVTSNGVEALIGPRIAHELTWAEAGPYKGVAPSPPPSIVRRYPGGGAVVELRY